MRLLLESESVSKALGLAAAAHKGQVDKAGEDYIKHPIAVAERLDIVEDTPVTLEDLANAGFSGRVLHAVCCLTHKYGETREAYISRIAEDPLAVRVKLADLAHNSDLSRMPAPSAKDYARAERYAKEAAFLMKANKQGGVSLEER